MAIRCVFKKMCGSTLIEFMTAALMGTIAVTITGSVFISIQRAAVEKTKHIFLMQSMTTVLQQLKEDIQRAGFDSPSTDSVTFSDSTHIVYVDHSNTALGYVYKAFSDNIEQFRHVVYRWDQHTSRLLLCEKHHPVPMSSVLASDSGYRGNCYSLFDPSQISVSEFSVQRHSLEKHVASAFLTIRLSAFLAQEPSSERSMTLKIKHRNWQ
ncbi:PilW family protein [Vibrio ziniensis]|uniref:Pilus assembly protein PilW n=1 Tax=Vibrio ziniensis TaxID=2711221 RepID=A0A6G7CGC2_9VIBR|nr:pilus assembly protein PilW [Vibrio ziniensis]QIH41123.1 pilus assembly protein PilW [Vibrio ziniensis]